MRASLLPLGLERERAFWAPCPPHPLREDLWIRALRIFLQTSPFPT